MATCNDCIHHSLCDYNTNVSGNGKIRLVYAEGADVKCSFFQNTADVVPKSESEFDNIPVEVAQVLKDKAVEKAKDEVAREIFEEIEKALNLSKCYGESGIYFERDIETDIAELKKKYTEVETMDEKKPKREENDS